MDASAYHEIGERDAVVARLQKTYPGLRPILFWSPYEAAAWTIIGQRIRIIYPPCHLVPARPGLSHVFRDRVVTAHLLMQGREMSRDTAVSVLCTVTFRSGRPVGTTNVDRRYRPDGDIAS